MEKSICKACGQEFKSDNALHKHVKVHNLTVAEYYTTYYPRKNKLTGDLLPSFKKCTIIHEYKNHNNKQHFRICLYRR